MSNVFAKEFKELRKASGLSQEEIAEKLGITSQAVSKWECAQSYPDIVLLPEIAKLFNVTIDKLLTGSITSKNQTFPFPDDNTLRVLLYKGQKLLKSEIPEYETSINLAEIINGGDVEIYGNCAIVGDLSCESLTVNGNLASYDISGDISCSGKLSCGNICGDVNVENGSVNCKNVNGDVFSEGNISCSYISGDINDRT